MIPFGGKLGSDGIHRFPVRVYYEDTDFSTNVYHAAYLKFFERARTEFLRALDIHHRKLSEEGVAFAVRSLNLDFEGAAHIDDVLEVTTEVMAVSGARLRLLQTLSREDALITRAEVLVVAIRPGGGPARLPAALRARLAGV